MSSWLIGAALFFSRRFEEAVPRLRVAIEDRPIFPTPRRFLAACYAHMGLLDEAQATVARLRALTTEVIPTYPLPFRDPAHRELYYSGLRMALGEETAPRGAVSSHLNPTGRRPEFVGPPHEVQLQSRRRPLPARSGGVPEKDGLRCSGIASPLGTVRLWSRFRNRPFG
jgi:hypothetical protein